MYKLLDYSEVIDALQAMARQAPDMVKLTSAGKSRIGRDMPYVTIGTGPIKVWVQARGRAVQALSTPGSLELIKALTDDAYAKVREKVTVLVIPLFVPDVDENWLDYTVDGVDLESDWGEMRAPESKIWLGLWKSFAPQYVINLHQMTSWPFVEGTTDICAFQVFTNLLRPGEELTAEQWDTNRRIGALAADAVKSLGVHPGKFWNHRRHHDAKPRRLNNLARMLRGLPLDNGAIHRVRGAVYFEVRKNGAFRAPQHVRNAGDEELVRIFPAAVLGVLVALADGSFDKVPVDKYENLPTGTMYTIGGTKPDWLDSGKVPDWVIRKEPPQWLLDAFASFARSRRFSDSEAPRR